MSCTSQRVERVPHPVSPYASVPHPALRDGVGHPTGQIILRSFYEAGSVKLVRSDDGSNLLSEAHAAGSHFAAAGPINCARGDAYST
jgi:hypothetical protein